MSGGGGGGGGGGGDAPGIDWCIILSEYTYVGAVSANYGIGGVHLKAFSFISDPLVTSFVAELLNV